MAAQTEPKLDEVLQPQSIEEVEKLVQRLYLPGSPQQITGIQHALQKLQRSQEGWQLANALLRSGDEKVRFFGALTFNIKINKDWDSLEAGDITALQEGLLAWLTRLVSTEDRPLVIKKLCSTLVAYALQPPVHWDYCIRHLVFCFYVTNVGPAGGVDRNASTAEMVPKLNESQLINTLWFATTLVEEVGKLDLDSIRTHKYHQRVATNLEDIADVLRYTMSVNSSKDIKVAQEGIKCFQSWVVYAHRAWADQSLVLDPLQGLTQQALQNLSKEGMFDVTQEFLTDILLSFPAFFQPMDYQSLASILCSPAAAKCVSSLRAGDSDQDAMTFARLLMAYGEAAMQDLAKNIEDRTARQILNQLVDLLDCQGYAIAEDEVCSQALDFWSAFAGFLLDSTFDDAENETHWMAQAKQYVARIVDLCWVKARIPPPKISTTWDADTRIGFRGFRSDVEDLLQSAYTLLGMGVYENFARLVLESLRIQAWLYLEASVFCLNALSDCVGDGEAGDEVLSMICQSSLFADMVSATAEIPVKTQQTTIALLNDYTAFFERRTQYLPAALNFLFNALKVQSLALVAAKAILTMCSSCRKSLVSELEAFLRQYEMVSTWNDIEAGTKEKVIGAIAAIVQALPTEEIKIEPLRQLITFVQADVHASLSLVSTAQLEDAQLKGVCALRCLVSMGKAMQVPDDVAVDLDSDRSPTVWEREPGLSIQTTIIQCANAMIKSMGWDSDIVEAACQILRAGYTETIPGPFVFPPKVTEDVVTSSGQDTARLGYVLDTAGIMLSRHGTDSPKEVNRTALKILLHVLGLIHVLNENPSSDPEVASSCIDLAEKFIPRYLDTFFDPQVQGSLATLFTFALRCLTASEILAKRSAADFWSSFVQITDQPDHIQSLANSAINQYGPLLSLALMRNIGGEAARSELETLAEPLKKMIFKQPKAKRWLSDALYGDLFPSRIVSDSEKRVWLQKVTNLRGAKGTNQVIKEFWMACRGTNLSYAS